MIDAAAASAALARTKHVRFVLVQLFVVYSCVNISDCYFAPGFEF